MPPINFITAIVLIFSLFALALAYTRLIDWSKLNKFSYYMMRGAMGFAAVSIARSGYWDVLQFFAGPENWVLISGFFGGQNVSAVFNIFWLWPIRDFLKARVELVPEVDRSEWKWWNVWMH